MPANNGSWAGLSQEPITLSRSLTCLELIKYLGHYFLPFQAYYQENESEERELGLEFALLRGVCAFQEAAKHAVPQCRRKMTPWKYSNTERSNNEQKS